MSIIQDEAIIYVLPLNIFETMKIKEKNYLTEITKWSSYGCNFFSRWNSFKDLKIIFVFF